MAPHLLFNSIAIKFASQKAGEKNEQPEKDKEVVVRGLPRGVIVASGDDFVRQEFSAAELEAAVRRGVALEANPVLPGDLHEYFDACRHPIQKFESREFFIQAERDKTCMILYCPCNLYIYTHI